MFIVPLIILAVGICLHIHALILKADYVDFQEDLERHIRIIQNIDDSDKLIDDFEERWKGHISPKKLRYAIGKLIDASFYQKTTI